MSVVVGIGFGVMLGILWARITSPRVSWFAYFALVIVTGAIIWVSIQDFSDEPLTGIIGTLALICATSFIGLVYLKEGDGMGDLPYRERLYLWMLPKARKAFERANQQSDQ